MGDNVNYANFIQYITGLCNTHCIVYYIYLMHFGIRQVSKENSSRVLIK